MNVPDAIVLAAYASLVVELTAFPIRSEASVGQLLLARDGGAGALARARGRGLAAKLLCYALPTAVGVALFLLPLAGIASAAARAALFPWSWPALVWPGVFLVVLGRVVTSASLLPLRRAQRPSYLPGGLFRLSRNPGLCGMYLFYLGLCLAMGGPWLWFGLPLYLGNMHQRVLLEEASLAATHGPVWHGYAARVARYLPIGRLR